ncbi:hypothetical protein D6C91_01008 [Aureobasidium pullulans]|uniref:Uncharacterized protein n=1 Tax=Aureobasidium pullulans TaxID=5580 RepID=A0A4S9U1P6_AURPU|nr:hypothetical protein D6C91_01008 [Aureobasidium pullulans]
MNQQYGAHPPSGQFYPTRRHNAEQVSVPSIGRAQQSPQDTTGVGSSLSTPLSPMFSPLGSGHSTHSNSTMGSRPYNPQQWGQPNVVGGSHIVFSPTQRITREATGMEASMPSPPPPYTPPPDSATRLMRSSHTIGFIPSPLSIEPSSSSTISLRSTPPHGPTAHFPPPPNSHARDRSSSGTGRARFSISGLAARVKRSDSSDQISTLNTQHTQTAPISARPVSRPPASRRAASTGALQTHTAHQVPNGRVSPESSHWEPGMPLPPPPPGPPPPDNRSQSLNRYPRRAPETRAAPLSVVPPPPPPPTRRRHENTLGMIPPTPSDWHPDMDNESSGFMELRIDTGINVHEVKSSRSNTQITRDMTTDSIRERRSRSRAKREGYEFEHDHQTSAQERIQSTVSELSKPTNLTLVTADSLLQRRRTTVAEASSSQSSPAQASSPEYTRRQRQGRNNLTVLTPPYTPSIATPLQKGISHGASGTHEQASTQPDFSRLPIDEPYEVSSTVASNTNELSAFTQSSLERYQIFVHQEATAENDRERLELFASFMVQESRIRRGRYSEAFNTMAGDIMELTRDMWRPLAFSNEQDINPTNNRDASPESANIMIDLDDSFHTSIASTAEFTPTTDTESLADESRDAVERRPANPWGDKFQPCLSPIPSMAVSTVPDEESSRGRSASRWWEESVDGSIGNGGRRVERTRQESKYMSLHPQELYIAAQPSPNQDTPTPSTSKQTFQYGPDEYPSEKIGWHEEENVFTPSNPPSAALLSPRNKAPVGRPAGSSALDVTRLVTLPPPYPRHYPAVNNSHPALSILRANHRSVANLSGIRELIQSHESTEASRRQAWRTSAGERLRHFRSQTQSSINTGKISYNDATQAELTFRRSEAANVLQQAETQCQDFRQRVYEPVHRMLSEHSRSCDECIEQLIKALDAEAECNQNLLAQTEGDERPELVEQLTLLKWLFESKEHIHKERFDIDTALMARESAAILTSYQQNGNEVQIRQVERHFESERQRRQLEYAQETNKRFDHLRKTVERHISRGVEIQLSAFWDIAPGLVEVVHKVPDDLRRFEMAIPANELAENVSYQDFPLQYMYTILVHAKKSAYQFIEAQTNLLCLLHEVHTATESASLRLREIERNMAGENAALVQAEMAHLKKQRELELTHDLQGKVHEVEEQWREALGMSIEDCIERVRTWLQNTGGWEESLEV